jgi:hypothetical protein
MTTKIVANPKRAIEDNDTGDEYIQVMKFEDNSGTTSNL